MFTFQLFSKFPNYFIIIHLFIESFPTQHKNRLKIGNRKQYLFVRSRELLKKNFNFELKIFEIKTELFLANISIKMKLFQSVQRQFAELGINSQQLIQTYPFNRTILLISFSYVCNIISYSSFMYYEANTFREYTDSVYVTSTNVLVAICFAIVVLQVEGFFKFISCCVEIVATSE